MIRSSERIAMKVYFRELTQDDIPDIKDISKNIWEGDDYVPYVIKEWLQDENCMNYGTFIDKNKTEYARKILQKGYAYEKFRSIYFDISRFKDYGKLSRIDLDKIKVGKTVDLDQYEKDRDPLRASTYRHPEYLQ